MKKILLSIVVIGVALVIGTGATTALFSDDEVSTGNTFTAGAIDLQIDNESYYNGIFNASTSWLLPADLDDGNGPSGNGAYLFFSFDDLKPGDWGEDTISVHVNDNDSWLCADVTLTSDDDNGINEPEGEDGDVTDGAGQGELADAVDFIWWADDGDNVLEDNEIPLPSGPLGALAVGETASIALADSTQNIWEGSGPLPGDSVRYIGKAWCFGELTLSPVPAGQGVDPTVDGGFSCNGAPVNNITQSDSMTADIGFRAVQSRHNDNFVCGEGGGGGDLGCSEQTDIMFVLDSSGSIDPTELGVMASSAKMFAAALAPTTTGNHIGVVDFDTDATLEQELTDVLASIDAAIDGLASGGNTNLSGGIDIASTELVSVRDRDDLTAPDFMVIMTDGEPNEGGGEAGATASANAAKGAGTTIYVVGIGDGVDDAFLETIATSPAHYFTSAEFDDLETILAGLAMCEL